VLAQAGYYPAGTRASRSASPGGSGWTTSRTTVRSWRPTATSLRWSQAIQLLRFQGAFIFSGYGLDTDDEYGSYLFVWRLDDDGEILDRWEVPEDDFRGSPAFAVSGARLFMLYSTGGFGTSEVQLREFGCAS
jgi:hypothetical protein